MRPIYLACLAVALLLTAAHADDWSKTYDVSRTPQLRVDTSDASIRLDTWDQNKIEVHVSTSGWKIGEGGIKIVERQVGDSVDVEVRFPNRHVYIDWGHHRVEIAVRMPREGKAALRTGDGHIVANGLKGDLELNSGDGRIEVDGADGSLRAHTGDGSMRIAGRFDSIDVSSGDGRVSLAARNGSRVDRTWEVRTSDGSVDLELPGDLAADLDLHTGDGNITINVPVTVEGKVDRQDVRGKINGGGNRLIVHTGDGSIRLDKS